MMAEHTTAMTEGARGITRRLFLRNTAAAGAVAATIAAPVVAEAMQEDPRKRLDAAVAELKAAAAVIFPDADRWIVSIGEGKAIPISILAVTPIGCSMREPFRKPTPGAMI